MSHPPPDPHQPLEKIFDDAWWLPGTIKMGPGIRINRNMIVLRDGEDLTVLNPVRMENDDALNALGKVTNVVRLGAFHGKDDRYYKETFGAKFWCQAGSNNFDNGPEADVVIEEGGDAPVSNGRFFVYADSKQPECAFLLDREGGLLVCCDSVQHHVDFRNVSFLGEIVMRVFGFLRPMNIGPPWLKTMTPAGGSLEPGFRRLLENDFEHGIGAHGALCRGGAKAALEATVNHVFK